MNRDIKFRAWDKEFHRMIEDPYHFEIYHYSDENRINQQTWRCYEGWRELEDGRYIECELMQFTGLHDKNNNPIYEGDILENPEGKKGIVVFDDGCFRLQIHKSETSVHYITMNQGYCGNKTIVSNIYESPLIK